MDKAWYQSKKIFVFLAMGIMFLSLVVLSAFFAIDSAVLSIMATGVCGVAAAVTATQGISDITRERKRS